MNTSLQGSPTNQDPGGSRFIVGQDASGRWLAVEINRAGGGFFKSRADALHFAAVESGRRPGSIVISSAPLQLF